ncbi:MAG: hypothetical protein IAB93_07155 [Bacteroidetes bacterium]|uniref:Uncharacterized protein n=1 Tax=Candidatus Merdivivens pullistercoris TaxID=2840873 RepID=A0A9D9NA57_9BACT|nr:hypothetical protein [Candidatus Merdivivens pullistercoris]
MKKLLLSALTLALFAAPAFAQDDEEKDKPKGNLSGSFETNTIYYTTDKGLYNAIVNNGAGMPPVTPEGHFGSNNYLKLDYTRGRLSVGIQLEGYLPALYGYDIATYGEGKKFMLANKYIRWQDDNFTVHVGDIYEQFGSGLIFRSYEDRALGFNNSLEGVFASYNFNNYVTLKGLYGRPRLYDYYADSWVRGADLSLSINDMFNSYDWLLSLEGSYINRYQNKGNFTQEFITTTNTNMYSGRLNFEYSGFYLSGEYVGKSKDLYMGEMIPGNAILAEAGYTGNGLAILGTFRRIDGMTTPLTYGNGDNASMLGTGNNLNFIPALTRQYTYLLTNLHPYITESNGEIGGQFDAYYSMRSKNDRRKRWSFHLNFSTYYSLASHTGESKMMWQDLNFDVERQWNRKLKTTFLYSWQQNNSHAGYQTPFKSHIFVYDMTYKINTYNSFRLELQYLYSPEKNYMAEQNEGDWVAALFEYNLAPRWSFYVSDMYNIDWTKVHYYNVGFSYSKGRTRIQLSYGRNRAGYICSGGVCRYTPAYTGFNLSLTSAF